MKKLNNRRASNNRRTSNNRRVYNSEVQILDAGPRTGMSCKTEIIVEEHDDARFERVEQGHTVSVRNMDGDRD